MIEDTCKNIWLDIIENQIKDEYRHIGQVPVITFDREYKGIEIINPKEYNLHIQIGEFEQLILPLGTTFIIRDQNDETKLINIKDIELSGPSQCIVKIPFVRCSNVNNRYSILEFFILKNEDYLHITVEEDINEPYFAIANILKVSK